MDNTFWATVALLILLAILAWYKVPAMVGKAVVVKGEIHSREDLYIDGEIQGTVELLESKLTIGPNGRIQASVRAREVVVFGSVQGNVDATEKIDIRKDAKLVGDIRTARIVIEDGAYFKGSIDIIKPEPKPAPKAASTPASTSASSSTSSSTSTSSSKPAEQPSLPASEPARFAGHCCSNDVRAWPELGDSTVLQHQQPVGGLHDGRPVGDEDDMRLEELIADPQTLVPEEQVIRDDVEDKLRRALQRLKPRDAEVLRLRFGLAHEQTLTLQEIGARSGRWSPRTSGSSRLPRAGVPPCSGSWSASGIAAASAVIAPKCMTVILGADARFVGHI